MSATFNYVFKFLQLDLFSFILHKNLSGLRQQVSMQFGIRVPINCRLS